MRVLVIQGAGMNMRGKSQIETFGPMTLAEMNARIETFAEELGVDLELFHSNIEGEVINRLYDAHEQGFDGAIINPAGFTTSTGALPAAIGQVDFPVIEVHASNPTARGVQSSLQPVCKGSIYGFGIEGYRLGLRGLLST